MLQCISGSIEVLRILTEWMSCLRWINKEEKEKNGMFCCRLHVISAQYIPMYRPKAGYNYYVSCSIARLRVAEMDFVHDIEKDDFLKAGGGYQPIQMASWPPVLPEPTSVRTLIERTRKIGRIHEPWNIYRANQETHRTNEFQSIYRTNKELAEPTSFRVFTERTRKLAEPVRLRILTE